MCRAGMMGNGCCSGLGFAPEPAIVIMGHLFIQFPHDIIVIPQPPLAGGASEATGGVEEGSTLRAGAEGLDAIHDV